MVIITKTHLDDQPAEEPPSYSSAVGPSSSSNLTPLRLPQPSSPESSYPSEKPPITPQPQTPISTSTSSIFSLTPSQPKSPALSSPPAPAGWISQLLGTPQAKADNEVRQTVLGLVQGIIQQGDSAYAIPIIQSCIDACEARGLSFANIVQERSIQGHTPLYWTIVKNVYSAKEEPPSSSDRKPNLETLFDILLSFPLTLEAYADALQACLLTSSHSTFLRLRKYNPEPPLAIPGSDEQDDQSEDTIRVTNGDDAEAALNGAFRVQINIKHFQKRMRVLKEVTVDFIARGRMWQLSFVVYTPAQHGPGARVSTPTHFSRPIEPGAWVLALDLVGASPSTWLDSRITIGNVKPPPPPAPPLVSIDDPIPGPGPSPQRRFRDAMLNLARAPTTSAPQSPPSNQLPPIALRMKTPDQAMLTSRDARRDGTGYHNPSRKERHQRRQQTCQIASVLSENAQASSLQFDGCPYLEPDGSLDVIIEAKLVKPSNNTDCVFM
ncbi:hypothetical protein FRC04_011964 [Tulasnella sp. 424]|nr:hypothetical protein FRC04_011964 [Tulasnella sp. 424]KAG8971336.1 hypothetical protein FRC05_011328 [Tulasnella sp. 425]